MTDRIAELERQRDRARELEKSCLESATFWRTKAEEDEAEIASLKAEPEWEEVEYGHGVGWTKFDQQGAYLAIPMPQSLVTFIENRAVDRYKRDQADAVGALRAVLDGTPGSHDRARATLRTIDEGERS